MFIHLWFMFYPFVRISAYLHIHSSVWYISSISPSILCIYFRIYLFLYLVMFFIYLLIYRLFIYPPEYLYLLIYSIIPSFLSVPWVFGKERDGEEEKVEGGSRIEQ